MGLDLVQVLHMKGGEGKTSYATNSTLQMTRRRKRIYLQLKKEVERVLHMARGEGNTSYARNSNLQRTVISMVKPVLEEAIRELYKTKLSGCLTMADLGCSAGPNTYLVVSEIIDILKEESQRLSCPPPGLQAFLNDLPGNDFNLVFGSWPSFYDKLRCENGTKLGPCFIAGVPGSFYSRLFPDNSLHFFHSSYSLMWTSKAPKVMNKENIYIAKTSPPDVFKAFHDQFKRDFTSFLKFRAAELVPGGRMLVTTMGSIKSDDPLSIWEVLGMKLHDMVLEGLIEKEKLSSFNIPNYTPTVAEIKDLLEAEGSFRVETLEAFGLDWDAPVKKANPDLNKKARAAVVAREIRAVGESLLATHFGAEIMDDLFARFEEDVLDHMEMYNCKHINLVLSLAKKD